MLSTNVRVGEACDFTTICDTAKVCEGGAGLHPQGSAEGGAKVAVREGNSQGSQPKDRASSVSPRYQRNVLTHSLNKASQRNLGGFVRSRGLFAPRPGGALVRWGIPR